MITRPENAGYQWGITDEEGRNKGESRPLRNPNGGGHLSCNRDARKYSRTEMKCTLSFLGWGACKKPRYGYYTRHAAHHGHAPSPFPSSLETGKRRGLIVALYLVNRRGSPITPLTGAPSRALTSFRKRGQRELKLEQGGTCTRTKMQGNGTTCDPTRR